jgi:hypothetical protein
LVICGCKDKDVKRIKKIIFGIAMYELNCIFATEKFDIYEQSSNSWPSEKRGFSESC